MGGKMGSMNISGTTVYGVICPDSGIRHYVPPFLNNSPHPA